MAHTLLEIFLQYMKSRAKFFLFSNIVFKKDLRFFGLKERRISKILEKENEKLLTNMISNDHNPHICDYSVRNLLVSFRTSSTHRKKNEKRTEKEKVPFEIEINNKLKFLNIFPESKKDERIGQKNRALTLEREISFFVFFV